MSFDSAYDELSDEEKDEYLERAERAALDAAAGTKLPPGSVKPAQDPPDEGLEVIDEPGT